MSSMIVSKKTCESAYPKTSDSSDVLLVPGLVLLKLQPLIPSPLLTVCWLPSGKPT